MDLAIGLLLVVVGAILGTVGTVVVQKWSRITGQLPLDVLIRARSGSVLGRVNQTGTTSSSCSPRQRSRESVIPRPRCVGSGTRGPVIAVVSASACATYSADPCPERRRYRFGGGAHTASCQLSGKRSQAHMLRAR